jgi:ubiquinone/menaquinone biosynthesis C-methylase UbiE
VPSGKALRRHRRCVGGPGSLRPSRQVRITRQFEQRSAWWDRVYEQMSLEAGILRRRQQVALTWVEQLSWSHPAGLRVLEIGCGAGATAVELARRGHLIAALDRSPAMLGRTLAWPIAVIVGLAVGRCWFDCG